MNLSSIDNPQSKAAYLRTLPAIRERCQQVYELAKQGKLQYFDYHPDKEADAAAFCVEIMKVSSILFFRPSHLDNESHKRDYGADFSSVRVMVIIQLGVYTSGSLQIQPHGRWRHLDSGINRVLPLIAKFHACPNPPDPKEEVRRIIDLFVVSVLLDAGAGNKWVFQEQSSGMKFTRSEGLGVASIHMFDQGLFSSDPQQPYRVDGT
jgi:Protein of unknown function (DUF1688)